MICPQSVNALLSSRVSRCIPTGCSERFSVHRQAQVRHWRSSPVKCVPSCSNRDEGPSSPDFSSATGETASESGQTNIGIPEPSSTTDSVSSSQVAAGDASVGTPIDHDNLPPELQNLRITEDGELIDDLTGKTVNAFGASRWDVGVRAMRGELDPPSWVEDTESSQGNIMAALFQFPREHCFQVVGSGGESFVNDAIEVVEQTCQESIVREKLKVTSRLGGKYSSVMMDIRVRAPEIIEMVHAQLKKDPRVKMCY